jgi:tetratricopeptide (TPR) repeat protein
VVKAKRGLTAPGIGLSLIETDVISALGRSRAVGAGANQESGAGYRNSAPKLQPFLLAAAACLFLGAAILFAEQGWLAVSVEDVGHDPRVPLAGIAIALKAFGSPAVTTQTGLARLRLPNTTAPGSAVELRVTAPDWAMVAPLEGKTAVPSFDNEAINYVGVGLIKVGSKAALKHPASVRPIAQGVTLRMGPQKARQSSVTEEQRRGALAAEASRLGFAPKELDAAIRAWGTTATTDFDRGLALLYEGNYAQATPNLERAAASRRETAGLRSVASNRVGGGSGANPHFLLVSARVEDSLLERAAKAAQSNDPHGAAHLRALTSLLYADLFFCESLYWQGQYREAIGPAREADTTRPNDPLIVSWLGVALYAAGDYSPAEAELRKALALNEGSPASLSNLAEVLRAQGNFEGAESLYKRAVQLDERRPGPSTPDMAIRLSNYGGLLEAEGSFALKQKRSEEANRDYRKAGELYKMALAIDEKTVGPKHPDYARVLNNLGQLARREKNDEEAERLFRRALEIDEAALGKEHPEVATVLNNLGAVLSDHGNRAEAEQLYRRALEIDVRALGRAHPDVARDLNNLASQHFRNGDYAGAEQLIRQAIAIDEKALGPDSPVTAAARRNLEQLLQIRKKQ